jgi:hypothetical protein
MEIKSTIKFNVMVSYIIHVYKSKCKTNYFHYNVGTSLTDGLMEYKKIKNQINQTVCNSRLNLIKIVCDESWQ